MRACVAEETYARRRCAPPQDKAGHRAASDATGSDEFLALVEARDVLLDASKRAEYDARLAHEEATKARDPSPWLAALRSPRVAFWRVMALANGGVPVHVPDYMTIWHALFALAVAAMLLDWVLPVVWHAVTCRYCRSGTRRSSGQGRRSAPAAAVRSGTSTTPSAMGGGHGERRGVGLTGEQATNGHQNGGSSPADELRRVRLLQQAAYDEKVAKEARRRPASRRSRTRR